MSHQAEKYLIFVNFVVGKLCYLQYGYFEIYSIWGITRPTKGSLRGARLATFCPQADSSLALLALCVGYRLDDRPVEGGTRGVEAKL